MISLWRFSLFYLFYLFCLCNCLLHTWFFCRVLFRLVKKYYQEENGKKVEDRKRLLGMVDTNSFNPDGPKKRRKTCGLLQKGFYFFMPWCVFVGVQKCVFMVFHYILDNGTNASDASGSYKSDGVLMRQLSFSLSRFPTFFYLLGKIKVIEEAETQTENEAEPQPGVFHFKKSLTYFKKSFTYFCVLFHYSIFTVFSE